MNPPDLADLPPEPRAATLALAALVCLLALLAPPTTAVEVPGAYTPPPDPVRDALEELAPKRLGVDSAGLLWAADDERVIFLADDGTVVRSIVLPAASPPAAPDHAEPAGEPAVLRDLAADSRWGVAVLDPQGTALIVLGPDGRPRREMELPDAAAHLAWVDAGTLALGLARAAEAVEIRPLDGDRPVRRLWDGDPPVAATPGMYFERSPLLAVHHGKGLLYVLESVRGELRVFSLADGSEVRRATLPNSRLDDLEQWRRGLGRTLGAAGQVRSALYTVLRLGVGDDGAAWVVSDCRDERRRAVLHRVSVGGAVEDLELPLDRACCSLAFTRWGERLVFNLDLPPVACSHVQTFTPAAPADGPPPTAGGGG